jgi:hypothetical protein
MTIAMANTRYVVARDGTHVYIVQTTAWWRYFDDT